MDVLLLLRATAVPDYVSAVRSIGYSVDKVGDTDHSFNRTLAAFLVDTLGIFGIFGNEIDQVPHSVLSADRRISWVVNNAYRWSKARTYVEKQRIAPGG